jgi:osmotically inducible protein OsmC
MAFASALAKAGFQPKQVETNAECTLQSKDGGFEISNIFLHARAQVPNIDDGTFQKLAKDAAQNCPVSKLLRPGVNIDLKADLVEGTFTG